MLGKILKEAFQSARSARPDVPQARAVLNVGGNTKDIPIPRWYQGWRHDLLDIDPRVKPDLLCDARTLRSQPPATYDAVYCSHNLEHYYRHDGLEVLRGFRHVLKSDGFVEIFVPDLQALISHIAETRMELDDTLYISPAGPIRPLDVIYGLASKIEDTGEDFFAHKTGFTPKLIRQALERAEFGPIFVFTRAEAFDLRAVAFKSPPTPELRRMLELPDSK